MKTLMNIDNLKTIESVTQFLQGSQAVAFGIATTKEERYRWISKVLAKYRYTQLSKKDKGTIIALIQKISGYSRQQVTRLIKQQKKSGKIVFRQRTTNGFQKRYTDADIRLLARMDELHPVNSGATIKKLCERAYELYGEDQFSRLAGISVSHLYNLRQASPYQRVRRHFDKTKAKKAPIGERKKPQPNGKPGYLRIDTVHQGDLDGVKGVYHINAVDEVTQYEVVVSVERISEAYLVSALEQIIEQFPFKIISIHSDNGGEYINYRVAELLQKLLIEMTKSRPRHSNDNALAESKNASVVRKVFGYEHLPQATACAINLFNQGYLNPYVNFHRPCYFPEVTVDKRGKQKKCYPYANMMTPYEKLKSLPEAKQYLRADVTFEVLNALAAEMSDNEAAKLLNSKRDELCKSIFEQTAKRKA